MSNYPKISIVTPCFNMVSFLESTILSVLNQGYTNLEYVIIDGGSTDGSVDIIKKYEDKLAYWVSESDNGMYDAINKGFERTTGEILTYINADDVLCFKSLFTIAEIFSENHNLEWITGVVNQIDENNRSVWVGGHQRWSRFRYYNLDYQWIQQEGTFWRRSLWEKAGGYVSSSYKLASDLELWCRFFKYAQLYVINIQIATFRLRGSNQKSLNQIDEYHLEANAIIKSLVLSKEDTYLLKLYNTFRINKLSKIPLLNKLWFVRKISNRYNSFPPEFNYNRKLQKFTLSNKIK